MSNSIEINIYLYLELYLDRVVDTGKDPKSRPKPATTNPVCLAALLREKENEWSRRVSFSPKFKSFLEVSRKWRANPTRTPQLEKWLNEAYEVRKCDLDSDIREYERNGILTQKEFEALVNAHSKYFSQTTIRASLHLPVSGKVCGMVIPVQPPQRSGIRPVDDMRMKSIDADLAIFYAGQAGNMRFSLYDVVGGTRGMCSVIIQGKAKKRLDAVRRNPLKTASVDAESRLLGQALEIFKSEESKRGYDMALEFPLYRIKDTRWSRRTLENTVSPGDYLLSVEEARENGLDKQEAEWCVYEYYCVKRKCPFPF